MLSCVTKMALDSGSRSTPACIAAFRKDFGVTPRKALNAVPQPNASPVDLVPPA